jgi:uncharacterized protein (TIGR02271 family)
MKKHGDKLIGAFDVQAEVLNKITELKQQGYSENDIYVVAQNHDQLSMVERQTDVHVDTEAAGSTRTTGTSQKEEGFMGKFMNLLAGEEASNEAYNRMGLDDEYRQHLEAGKLLVYVDSDYDSSYREYNDRRSTTDTDFASGSTFGSTSTNEEERLRLHEERLNVGKERVKTGEVNVGKHVIEEEQTIEVPVEREEVFVERRPVNEDAATYTDRDGTFNSKDAFTEGETIRVPLTEERVEVSKKDVVTEEIVVGKRKVQDTEHVNETVRKEVADIDGDVTDTNRDILDRDRKDRDRF